MFFIYFSILLYKTFGTLLQFVANQAKTNTVLDETVCAILEFNEQKN